MNIKSMTLGDVCENVSRPFDYSKYERVVFINTGDVLEGKFLHKDYSEKEDLPGQAKKAIKRGDILFSEIRPINKRFAFVDQDCHEYVVSTKFMVLRSKNDVTPKYLYHYLKCNSTIRNLQREAESRSGTFPQITFDSISYFSIPVPLKDEQERISVFLDKIEEKIELNKKMNENLEKIAKTLFKSWFIDFDPVRAKAEERPTGLSKEISDLFPDCFEDSELGEIPSGWKLSNLDANLEFVLGGDWGKEELKDDFNKEVVCIRGADIPNLQTFVESNPPKRFIKESSLEKRELKEGDLVLEISGGSPTQSTGRVVYITKEFLSTQDCPVVFSNFCRILRSDSTLSKYVYYYLRTLYDSDKLFQYETGTTGIKNFGYKHFSEEVFFAIPNIDLLKTFSEIIESFLIKKGKNLREIITLTNLRDILLPKLISGELKISDADNFIEEIGI